MVEAAADRIWRVAIEPDGHRPATFVAGQFAWLNLGHSPFSLTEHPFSFASAPVSLPRLEFVIKENGDFTRTVGAITPGTMAYLDGPHGIFTLAGRDGPRHGHGSLVLIAGGAGIAPALAILRDLAARGEQRSATLIYGNRRETQIVAREELERLQATMGLRLILPLGEPPATWHHPHGGITHDVLAQCLGPRPDAQALYLVCGPPAMMDTVEAALLALGVPRGRIVCERFRYD
jgi:predicted ferric reductase